MYPTTFLENCSCKICETFFPQADMAYSSAICPCRAVRLNFFLLKLFSDRPMGIITTKTLGDCIKKHWLKTTNNCGLQNVVMQNIEKHEVLYMKAAVRQTTQGEDGEQRECFETQTSQSFLSFPLKWVNDFITVSAHFKAKKIVNWRLLLMYY